MSQVLIIDTETTGFAEPVEAVEVAWIAVDPGPTDPILKPVTTFQQRYKPEKPISFGAMATHHITDEDLVDCPPSSDFVLPEGTTFIVGHNIDFDWNVIGKPEIPRICTLALSRRLWPDDLGHSVGAMIYRLLKTKERAKTMLKDAHSAYQDVLLTRIILHHILEQMPKVRTWEKLWEASERARIPVTMPFGKHKGIPMAELPIDYCEWLLKQSEMDPYLLTAVRQRIAHA
ncbi:3'-5' exonuclease [Acidithiobacillus ferrivorans]|nr:3'-5' exonuclease [Acidithiobacillus ferrivorans]